ncbi:MAG TPA: alpha/beta hydrolase [Spirochaetota bacterium]|nr:alpha/beta hydrolase [Spirochaetota bacterium]HPJ34941.1 alpha/beta hydrolase [Spirochaetota bacterium]
MDYSEYTTGNTEVNEYMVMLSDGVSLKVVDFKPEKADGNKPSVIFIAGWISLINGWQGVLKELTSEYRVFYIESREKRSSVIPEKTKVSFTMNRFREDIKELVKMLVPGDDKFVLAGSSLGASAILEYCAQVRRKPECAILVGPNEDFRFPRLLGAIIPLIPPVAYFTVKPVIKWYLRNFRLDKKKEKAQVVKYERTLDLADPYKLKANALALKNYSIWERIQGISTPCLIFGATTDKLHSIDKLKKLVELIPEVQYIELGSNSDTHSEKAGRVMVDYLGKREYRNFSSRV